MLRRSHAPPLSAVRLARVLQMDFSYLKCLEKVYPLPAKRGDGKSPSNKRSRGGDDSGAAAKRQAGEGGEAVAKEVEFTKGQIVVIRELADGLDFEALKEKFGGKEGGCAFVEVVPDMPLAYVRFNSAEQAQAALSVEGVGTAAVLEGDDEKQYWEKIASGGGGKGGGKGKGGKGKGKGKGRGKGGKGKGGGRGRGR